MCLAEHILSDPSLRVLGALWNAPRPRGVRETADLTGLSPRGASIVLLRLVNAGLAIRRGSGRQVKFAHALNREDGKMFESIRLAAETRMHQRRAFQYSRDARDSLAWMDGTLKSLRRLRRKYRGAPQVS